MKRLVDESTDELTRSLLAAGIEHRPASGNKAQVIVALGAGSAIGLLGSNAFAWLGTTAGKVTAAGVTVGVAGALFVVAPALERRADPHAAVRSGAVHSGAGVQARPAIESALPAQPTPAGSPESTVEPRAARATAGMSEGDALLEPASDGSASSAAASSPTPASASDKAATKKLSSWRERRLVARRKAVLARAAVAKAASSAPSAASQNEPAAASASASTPASTPDLAATVAAEPAAAGVGLLAAEKLDLDSEVRLVDDMHWAARRNDRAALGRFLTRYRETFPDGQLKNEVAEFATRLEQPDTSRAP